MERLDEYDALLILQHANERLGRFFARFSGAPVLGTDEEVEALLQVENTLRAVGQLLNGRLQNNALPAMRDQLASYRANLLRLRQELAAMQSATLSCRARLVAREKHLHAAKAWCAASRATW